MAKVTLDALIPREDFEVKEDINPVTKKETISVVDFLPDSFFYPTLRKPDFQRETNQWESKKIAQFLLSFLVGDLIPAIILWRSTSGHIFVIDGSHRLSSLFAWINDDYGDGEISKHFYDAVIPIEQINIAEKARKLINKEVGSYRDYKLAISHPEKVRLDISKRTSNLGVLGIQIQWVEGNAAKAENSFFKINQQAAPLDKTEIKILESRRKPNSISSRAIIRSGKGHKYWSKFSQEKQGEIQALADEINTILFSPTLDTPIKTLDIPIGGKALSAQALPLVFDFVNLANSNFQTSDELMDDDSGENTISYLKKTRKVARIINSNHSSSLGLHPVVYFYSQDGRFKNASFFAMVGLIMDLILRRKLNDFIKVREKFEMFIQKYNYIVDQINRKHRSVQKSYQHIATFFNRIISLLNEEKSIDESVKILIKEGEYDYLTIMGEIDISTTKTDFSTAKKRFIRLTRT